MGGWKLAAALGALIAAGLGLALLTADPPPRALKAATLGGFVLDKALSRIALGSSCDQRGAEAIWATLAQTEPDLFLFAGNAVYGDAVTARPGLPELAAAYGALAHQTRFRRLERKVPVLAIWDDHDYGREAGDKNFAGKGAAKEQFLRFWNIAPEAARAQRPGLYDSRILGPVGRRVQIILLDVRWFKDPARTSEANGRPRFEADPDPTRTLLGAAQWSWLAAELKKEAELRLIVSPMQVEAEGSDAERWGDFPAEQQRLFDLIAQTRANGVVFVSGNRGAGGLYRRDAGTPYPLFEISAGPLNKPAWAGETAEQDRLGPLLHEPNFGLVTIDWVLRTVRLELKDGAGRTALVASAPVAALAPPAPSNLVREDRP